MLIRCQSCQALFSLQDGVAAAGAAFKVECGRCLAVFAVGDPAVPSPAPAGQPQVRKGLPITLVLAMLLVGAALAVVMRFGGLPKRAQERIAKARELLLLDDRVSLEQATALFTEAARMAPGEAAPEGERAFALLLQAAAQKDLSARAPKDQADEYARKASRSMQEGLAAAKAAMEDDREDSSALRALALHAALAGAPDIGVVSLHRAELAAPHDPWVAWTRAALALSGPASREKQDRALAALAVARQVEPRMLRAQVDAAAIAIDRQESGPARDVLANVLKENPQHERAKRLLALLPASP